MINILFLMPHASTGGMPQFTLKRIESLIKHSNDFNIFVIEYSNISDIYTVQKEKIKNLIKPENFFTLYEDKTELLNIIKENKIDIIHSEEILEGYDGYGKISDNILNELYSKNRTWKIIETCHNIWFNPDNSKKFNPDVYAFCTPWHLNTFSNMNSKKDVIQYPIESKIPTNEQKIEAKNKLGFDLTKKHVINIGLWTPGKNQKEGIDIARSLEITNPEIQFHFIGNQAINFKEYWGPIMENIPSNVKVWGERSDIEDFLNAADVFMFNSTWECNPIVLKEAISHGLSILSRNLPQYMNMFNDYIVDINDDIILTKYKLIKLTQYPKKYEIKDELQKFENSLINLYKNILNIPIIEQKSIKPKIKIIHNFILNPYVEILGDNDNNDKYKIEFYDEKNKCHYSETLPINHWVKLNRQYYTKWNIKIWENDNLIYNYILNLKDKRVYISFESKSLGDTLAWMPYVKEFKDKHQCNLIVSTFMNHLFKDTYQDIEFVEPGQVVNNIYAMYKIGWFYKDNNEFDEYRNPNDFKKQPMQKTATDILGLQYKEMKPILKIPNVEKSRKVGIAIHATAQAKYWNNPQAWQEVINYLNSLGYDPILYSKENNGYMGNFHPQGVIKFESGSLESLIKDLATCQFFIGIGSGLSWLAWSIGIPVILISGFSDIYTETQSNTYRIINKNVCHGCFNRHRLNASDWNWCPDHKNTERQFECTKTINSNMVIDQINRIIQKK